MIAAPSKTQQENDEESRKNKLIDEFKSKAGEMLNNSDRKKKFQDQQEFLKQQREGRGGGGDRGFGPEINSEFEIRGQQDNQGLEIRDFESEQQ